MKQTKKRIGSLLVAVCMVLTMLPTVAFAEEGVPSSAIDITTKFTDANFLAEVRKALGKEANDLIYDTDNFASVTTLSVQECNIASLTGIEYFTALRYLACSNNQLTGLDVSNNTALTHLYCNSNQLTELDVSNNTALIHLLCDSNQLTALDVSNNTTLTSLNCYGNQLAALNVSNNTKLTELTCNANQLTALDVSNNTVLTHLYCNGNQLTKLDVSNNTALTNLNCFKNYMADKSAVTGINTNLTTSFTFDPQNSSTPTDNNITAKFTDANFLAEVRRALGKNEIASIYDTDNFDSVTSLSIGSKNITSLAGIEYFEKLTNLSCQDNQLSALDVSQNTALTYLSCYTNQLTELDVSNNTALTYLSCKDNQLSELDMSKNTALEKLYCQDNQLSALDVSQNTALTTLWCNGNQLSALDVSKNTKLGTLNCSGNYMADKSAVKGLDTSRTTTFIFDPQKTSTSTYSITVNSGTASPSTAAEGATVTITANTPDNGKRFKEWTVDSGGVTLANAKLLSTTFTMPAKAVEVTATYENIPAGGADITAKFTNAYFLAAVRYVLGKAPTDPIYDTDVAAVTTLNVSNRNITSLSGIEHFTGLTTLDCSRNQLTTLDVTQNTALTNLNCSATQLTTLNVTQNTVLTNLDCSYNQLTALNVTSNTALTTLNCSTNQLATLNVTSNTELTVLDCYGNQLSALDVSQNTALTTLKCAYNNILDISAITGLDRDRTKSFSFNHQNVTARFTDANFRAAVRIAMSIGVDDPIYNTTVATFNTLNVPNKDISSLAGIEYLTGLNSLDCSNNQLTALDVSKNTALTTLNCSNNYMAAESAVTGLDKSRTTTFTFNPQKTSTSTYAITVNSGTASQSTAAENAIVTITADAAPSGQRFKEWTVDSGGVTLASTTSASTTFTMPANAVEVTATYENIPAGVTPVTGVTLNKTALSLYSNTSTKTANLTATITPADATDKSVTWQSLNPSVATVDESGQVTAVGNGMATITVTTTDVGYTASCIVTVSTYTSGGSSSSGGGSGGGSSSGGTPTKATTVTEKQPNQPITAVASVTATAGTNGTASASISDKAVTDAIAKAQAELKKQSKTANGIAVGLNVTMPKGATTLTATLRQNGLNSLVSAGVTNLEINGAPIILTFDQKVLTEIQKQSSGNVNIAIAPQAELSKMAKALIGTRPVYNITVGYGNNMTLSSFGGGVATVGIPYTPANGEAIGGLYAVYVDQNGNASRVAGSAYDANSGCIIFTTTHFSMYGVGYSAPSAEFADISSHWAKESIDYVVGRGLLSGTSETTFAPNTAMTRGMLVTALGRLEGVDISSYTKNSFTDVKAGSTFNPYIEWAYEKGIIQGIGNNKFAPDRAITREEIAVIVANFTKATGYTLPVKSEATTYADDSSISSSYKTAVAAMQQAGIMMGGTSNKFNPKSNATRAEVSSMLYRYMKLNME